MITSFALYCLIYDLTIFINFINNRKNKIEGNTNFRRVSRLQRLLRRVIRLLGLGTFGCPFLQVSLLLVPLETETCAGPTRDYCPQFQDRSHEEP